MSTWAKQRKSLVAFLAVFVSIGASIGIWLLVPAIIGAEVRSSEQFSAAGDVTTYGYSNAHMNFNAAETNITASTAHKLKQKWVHSTKNSISDQPAVTTVGGKMIVFWGSWDGYLHATNVNTSEQRVLSPMWWRQHR